LIRNVEFRTILARDIYTENLLAKSGLNERQIKAINFVKEHGQITNKEYVKLTSVASRQALTDLKGLVEKKLFSGVGKGRSARYSLRK